MVTARLLGWREEEGPVSASATAAAEVNLKNIYIYKYKTRYYKTPR